MEDGKPSSYASTGKIVQKTKGVSALEILLRFISDVITRGPFSFGEDEKAWG